MLKDVPVEFWLLSLITLGAFKPGKYLYDRVAGSVPDLDGRWPLIRNGGIILGLAALAVFIFTPTARSFAASPGFWPMLMAIGGAWVMGTVVHGYFDQAIEPLIRGVSARYQRETQPRRYWASMTWNLMLGGLFLWAAFGMQDQADREDCHDWKNSRPPHDVLEACNGLIESHGVDESDSEGLLSARGSAYYRSGDYRRAKRDYLEAVRRDPADSSSQYNLGLVEEQMGNAGAAMQRYDAAIRIDGKNADAFKNRGNIYLGNAMYDQAISDFSAGHEIQPDDPAFLALRGLSHAWKRDVSQAERDLSLALKMDPTNVIAMRGKALLAMDRGDAVAAISYLSRVLERYPQDDWSLSKRAEAYRRIGARSKMEGDIATLQNLDSSKIEASRDW